MGLTKKSPFMNSERNDFIILRWERFVKKWISTLLIVVGLSCLFYGGWQILSTKFAQKEALQQAKAIVSEKVEQVPNNFNPKVNESIGILKIPKINAELPIVEGTGEDDLAKGVGHYRGTAFPGQKDQIVFSGHRETVFQKLGELNIGDEIIVEMSYGIFKYAIQDFTIVDAHDQSVIRSTAPEEVLTITTCYPFTYIGSAPERYIIYATPVL